jgi:hypothetical protein
MKTEVHDNIIYVPKKKMSMTPVVLSMLAFLFILLGAGSVFLIQNPLQNRSFDDRNQASVANGQVVLSSTFQDISSSNTQAHINVLVNTHGVQTDGIQVVFNIVTQTSDGITVKVPTDAGLQAVKQEVQTTSDGYLVSLIAVPSSLGQSFSSTTEKAFLEITLTTKRAGEIKLVFDQDNSISTVSNTNPPRNELKTIPQFSYTTIGTLAAATATPTPIPTPSPSPTPTATPIVLASPTPTPTPVIGVGGVVVRQCNESCTASSQCAVNLRCYEGACRLATNVSSSSCSTQTDQGLNRSCNQYCADSRECQSGYSCFNNQCRRPDNPDSASCAIPTQSTTAAIAQSCNKSCNSNKDCATNLRCSDGVCRLATNPSSLTCSSSTASTVSSLYAAKGSKGEEIPYPSVEPTSSPVSYASPVISPRPSVAPTRTTEDTSQDTMLSRMIRALETRGISLPMLIIGIGIFLLIIAILTSLLKRGSAQNSPKITTAGGVPRQTEQEKNLQERIRQLKEQGGASAPTQTTPVQTPPPSPAVPPSQPPRIETAVNAPISAPPQATTDSTSSSMLQRLKDKGVMEKIPNPTDQQS